MARILILEDSPALRFALSGALQDAEPTLEVVTAKLVAEALAREEDFDVLLFDRFLQNGEGQAAFAKWPDAVHILMSGFDPPGELNPGVTFLPKPFSVTRDLIPLIKAKLGGL